MEQVSGMLHRLAWVVRMLGAFAALSGLTIMAASTVSSRLRRAREAALLRTLGLSRARVTWLFAIEYALSASVACSLGALFAYGLSQGLATWVLTLSASPSWGVCFASAVTLCALATAFGLLSSARALSVRPLQVLREG
jgi:putative ABC transport system permease protein